MFSKKDTQKMKGATFPKISEETYKEFEYPCIVIKRRYIEGTLKEVIVQTIDRDTERADSTIIFKEKQYRQLQEHILNECSDEK